MERLVWLNAWVDGCTGGWVDGRMGERVGGERKSVWVVALPGWSWWCAVVSVQTVCIYLFIYVVCSIMLYCFMYVTVIYSFVVDLCRSLFL